MDCIEEQYAALFLQDLISEMPEMKNNDSIKKLVERLNNKGVTCQSDLALIRESDLTEDNLFTAIGARKVINVWKKSK